MTRRRTSPARGTSPRREPAGPRESQAWLAARGGSHSAPMCVLMLAHREVRPWALTTSHKISLQRPYSHPLPLLSNKQLLGYAALLFKTGHFVGSPNENSRGRWLLALVQGLADVRNTVSAVFSAFLCSHSMAVAVPAITSKFTAIRRTRREVKGKW